MQITLRPPEDRIDFIFDSRKYIIYRQKDESRRKFHMGSLLGWKYVCLGGVRHYGEWFYLTETHLTKKA